MDLKTADALAIEAYEKPYVGPFAWLRLEDLARKKGFSREEAKDAFDTLLKKRFIVKEKSPHGDGSHDYYVPAFLTWKDV